MSQLLTSSGECAVFVDDNQFASGQSQDKCGPEIVSLFWHSAQPGQSNPYTSADIHTMAHDDYEKFIGPDVASDGRGTDNQALYDMLAYHHFEYKILPLDWSVINGWLNAGYPVIIGGVEESSVFDIALNGNPYNWNTDGLYHIILASGPGGLFRDTANIDHNGVVRPGPRHYDTSRLVFSTATLVNPSWLQDQSDGGSVPPVVDHAAKEFEDCWKSTAALFGGSAPIMSTGICASWQSAWRAGHQFGPPITAEYSSNDMAGQAITCQQFAGGRCEWSNGKARWFCGSGEIKF